MWYNIPIKRRRTERKVKRVMFGYIRPVESELLVREYELYRSVYCGLCRYGGKKISHFTRFLLNYDFVALAMLRIALTDEPHTITKTRCPYRLKKRSTMLTESAFELTCAAFALLVYYKALDDISDSRGFKRIFSRLTLPFFVRIKRKVKGYDRLEGYIKERLDALSVIESTGESTSLDAAADCFAGITRYIAAYGIEGSKGEIAAQCGYHIGRYIYIIDALDDIARDSRSGSYNPLLNKYGSVKAVLDNIEEIKTTVTDSLNAFSAVYGLCTIDSTRTAARNYDNIIFNICELGGRAALDRVLQSLAREEGEKLK